MSLLSSPVLILASFSARSFSNNTEAGSSEESCGTNLPWIAKSRILDFACLMAVCKSDLSLSIESIRVRFFLTCYTISFCSFKGGSGTKKELI